MDPCPVLSIGSFFLDNVAIPLVLSIYASIVVSRKFVFQAELARAREAALSLFDRFDRMNAEREKGNPGMIENHAVWVFFPTGLALKTQGHRAAAATLGELSSRYYEILTKASEAYAKALADPENAPPSRDLGAGPP